jgi:hypothetical protein
MENSPIPFSYQGKGIVSMWLGVAQTGVFWAQRKIAVYPDSDPGDMPGHLQVMGPG